ncbi:MAG: TrbI/VirB10 family protein [Bdellovibrionaceae bacterium]|nr:TrbI/VirB10 family protein [Pseudobdellovibrionaceae bacterium]
MEVKSILYRIKNIFSNFFSGLKTKFFTQSTLSHKKEVNLVGFKWMGLLSLILFVGYVLFMPNEVPREFSQKMKDPENKSESEVANKNSTSQANAHNTATGLWNSHPMAYPQSSGSGGSQVNHNTPMVIGSSLGNAKMQFRAGIKIPLKIVDKFIVSQDSVPILAESILDSMTDAGIKIPAGTKFYGEANFQRGSDRAQITFKQISLPSGEIKALSGIALSKDGQNGILGKVSSDGVKNSAGQVITAFVGGLAAGSIQTDAFGRSKGGVENGLLTAVSETARTQAQKYGERLKEEREWIEVSENTECDILLKETFNPNQGGNP